MDGEQVDFLVLNIPNTSDSTITLTSPQSDSYKGVHAASLDLAYEGVTGNDVYNLVDFTVTIN